MFHKYDFEILSFIQKSNSWDSLEIKEILQSFPNSQYGTKERLKEMLLNDFLTEETDFHGNCCKYSITSKGIVFLQNHLLEKKQKYRTFLFKLLKVLFSFFAVITSIFY